MAEHFSAQVGHNPLAERSDEVVAHRACERENSRDCDHHGEIALDEVEALVGEAEINHAAHREWHRQGGQRGRQERANSSDRAAAIALDVGEQQNEGLEPPRRRCFERRLSDSGGAWCLVGDLSFSCGGPLDDIHATQYLPVRSFCGLEFGQCPAQVTLAITLDELRYLGYRPATFSNTAMTSAARPRGST